MNHSCEGKTIKFSPNGVVIDDLKYHKHILAIETVDDIIRLYKFANFGPSFFLQFLLLIVMN
jgi:hypothetical protein